MEDAIRDELYQLWAMATQYGNFMKDYDQVAVVENAIKRLLRCLEQKEEDESV